MKHLIIAFLTLSSFHFYASNNRIFVADTTQVTNESVLYKVSQDDNYVYVNLSTVEKKTAMSILKNGLTIYYDIKGKKKKDVYVKYPYSNEPGQFRQEGQRNSDITTIDFESKIEKLPAEAEYNSFDDKQTFNKDLNSLDITIENKYTASNEIFEFSIKIPKYRIASKENTDFSKLSIGVVTNKKEGNFNKSRNEGQSQGMRSGGGRGGRRGGGNRGGGMGRQGGQDAGSRSENATIDFWFDAN
ncbi:hypothetical protein ACFSSB_03915 [Lacinutrix gracilariae]|uniref:Uncharacterized protein n=1 Tax=Lacinutrix gracilariae TaxID=1747198 RepID=A0ABW5JZ63_9FLAO